MRVGSEKDTEIGGEVEREYRIRRKKEKERNYK